MSHVRPLTAVGAAALVVLSLAGCTGSSGDGDDGSPTPTAAATSSAAPTASGTPTGEPAATPAATAAPDGAPVVAIPTDCTQIVDAATYQATMGSTPLNPEGFVRRDGSARGARTPGVPAAGADPVAIVDTAAELDCLWRDPRADITGLSVQMGRLDQATAASLLQQAEAGGASCSDAHAGRVCQLTQVDEQYGTDGAETYFVRGDLFIEVGQSNFPTNDLLGSILTRLES
jgi:hypothetical protein